MKATTFGQRLRQLRLAARKSINELGRDSDTSPIGVSRLERDLTSPDGRTMHRLARALGVSLAEFDGVRWPEKNPRKKGQE